MYNTGRHRLRGVVDGEPALGQPGKPRCSFRFWQRNLLLEFCNITSKTDLCNHFRCRIPNENYFSRVKAPQKAYRLRGVVDGEPALRLVDEGLLRRRRRHLRRASDCVSVRVCESHHRRFHLLPVRVSDAHAAGSARVAREPPEGAPVVLILSRSSHRYSPNGDAASARAQGALLGGSGGCERGGSS